MRSPPNVWTGPISTPGASVGTRNIVRPRCGRSWRLVRVSVKTYCARCAVVVSGANLTLDAAVIARLWAPLWAARVMLLQNEIPEPINLAAAVAARQRGARIILNAAPARAMPPALLNLVDILIVNRVEARMLSGCEDMDAALRQLGAADRDLILTRGGAGLSIVSRDGRRTDMAAHPVKLLSSHGAGDCFCGALAARIASGDDIVAAVNFARVAAALLVSCTEDERASLSAETVRAEMGMAQ